MPLDRSRDLLILQAGRRLTRSRPRSSPKRRNSAATPAGPLPAGCSTETRPRKSTSGCFADRRGRPSRPRRGRAARDRPRRRVRPGRPRPRPRHRPRRQRPAPGRVRLRRSLHRRLLAEGRAGRPPPRRLKPGTARPQETIEARRPQSRDPAKSSARPKAEPCGKEYDNTEMRRRDKPREVFPGGSR